MGGTRYTAQEIVNAKTWRDEGYTYKQIATKLGRTQALPATAIYRISADGKTYQGGEYEVDLTGVVAESYRKPRSVPANHTTTAVEEKTTVTVSLGKHSAIIEILSSNLSKETKKRALEAFL